MAYLGNVVVNNGVLNVNDPQGFVKSYTPLAYNFSPQANTLAYWPLNGDTLDYSGNGNNLTITGTTEANYPKFQQATHFSGKMSGFNGTNGSYSSYYYTSNSLTLPTTDFTFSCWIFPTRVDEGNFMSAAALPSQNPYYIFFGIDGGRIGGIVGGNEWFWGSDLTVSANVWYNVVCVYTDSNTTYTYYLNGSAGTPKVKQHVGGSSGIFLGEIEGGNGGGYRQYGGFLREVIIDTGAWTASDVITYYNSNR